MSKLEIAKELSKIGRSNMLEYMTIDGDGVARVDLSGLDMRKAASIGQIEVEEFLTKAPGDDPDAEPTQVRRIRFKLHDKIAALRDLAKLKGYMVEKKEHTFKRLSEMSDSELEMLLLEATGEET
jgi:phage terminase small subunit